MHFIISAFLTLKAVSSQEIQLRQQSAWIALSSTVSSLPAAFACHLTTVELNEGIQLDYNHQIAATAVVYAPTNSSHKFATKSIENLGRSIRHLEKLRHVRCFTGIVAAGIERLAIPGNPDFNARYRPQIEVIYPDNIVLITEQDNSTSGSAKSIFNGAIVLFLKERALHAPPVYLVINNGIGSSIQQRRSYWLLCWYCGNGDEVRPIAHADLNEEYKNSIGTHGLKVKWAKARSAGEIFGIRVVMQSHCPFVLQKNLTCNLRDPERMLSTVLSAFNATLLAQNNRIGNAIPQVSFGTISRRTHPFDIEVTGYAADFRFITSDSVTIDGAGIGSLVEPFEKDVWIFTIITVAVTAVALSLFKGVKRYESCTSNKMQFFSLKETLVPTVFWSDFRFI